MGRPRRAGTASTTCAARQLPDGCSHPGRCGQRRTTPSAESLERLGGHPGVIVSYVSVRGPLEPVRCRGPPRVSRWRPMGAATAGGCGSSARRGCEGAGRPAPKSSRCAPLVAAPACGCSRLRVGGHRSETPLAVQGRQRQPVLVVLPVASWQATQRARLRMRDGFPDTLTRQSGGSARSVPSRRGLPAGFARAEAPLLRFLDREGLRYDLTTDLALAAAGGRPPIRYRGILFAGAPACFTEQTGRLVRVLRRVRRPCRVARAGWPQGELAASPRRRGSHAGSSSEGEEAPGSATPAPARTFSASALRAGVRQAR